MNQPLLSVNNLTHLYAPGKGFSDVSFDLWPGEVMGIVGESGSGKTTLLKSISARLTCLLYTSGQRWCFTVCQQGEIEQAMGCLLYTSIDATDFFRQMTTNI